MNVDPAWKEQGQCPPRSRTIRLTTCASSLPSPMDRPIRKDPVKFRVAIPAADPPDNIPRMIPIRAL